MRAARVDYEDSIRRAIDPDAVFLLKLCIHSQTVFFGIPDLEAGCWLEQSAGQKEAEESQEPRDEKSGYSAPH